jgi:hypothetical protein
VTEGELGEGEAEVESEADARGLRESMTGEEPPTVESQTPDATASAEAAQEVGEPSSEEEARPDEAKNVGEDPTDERMAPKRDPFQDS